MKLLSCLVVVLALAAPVSSRSDAADTDVRHPCFADTEVSGDERVVVCLEGTWETEMYLCIIRYNDLNQNDKWDHEPTDEELLGTTCTNINITP